MMYKSHKGKNKEYRQSWTRKEKGKEMDSTVNKNYRKYRYEHWQTQNQMCLSTTFIMTS